MENKEILESKEEDKKKKRIKDMKRTIDYILKTREYTQLKKLEKELQNLLNRALKSGKIEEEGYDILKQYLKSKLDLSFKELLGENKEDEDLVNNDSNKSKTTDIKNAEDFKEEFRKRVLVHISEEDKIEFAKHKLVELKIPRILKKPRITKKAKAYDGTMINLKSEKQKDKGEER